MEICIGCLPVTAVRDVPSVLGVPRRRVAALIEDGTLARLNRVALVGGCLAERAASDRRLAHLLKVRAALIRYTDCVASHESAALAHGLPIFAIPPYVSLTRTAGAWRGGQETRVRIAPLEETVEVDGIRCTALGRTVVDIARTRPLREAAVVGDAALRRGVGRGELVDALDQAAAWADVGRAARAVAFFDQRAESALESVSRVEIHEAGLPDPELQWELRPEQYVRYRLDFYWEAQKVIGEADGLSKYTDPGVIRAEKLRQEDLERLDKKVVRWTWRQMVVQTPATIARLREALG